MSLTVTHATVATAADDPTAEINKAEWNADHTVLGGVCSASITFTQTAGDGIYTGSVTLPAGAVLVDIIVAGEPGEQWDSTTAALTVSDDTFSFISGFDLTDAVESYTRSLALTEMLAQQAAGGTAPIGSWFDTTVYRLLKRIYPAGGTITASVTQTGNGTAGRTTVTVIWAEPTTTAAVKS